MWWKQRGGRGVRRILMEHWDPIGVSGVPEARDEYDGYIGTLGQMLREQATRPQIEAYLQEISVGRMGIEDTTDSSARRHTTVTRLLAWYANERATRDPTMTDGTLALTAARQQLGLETPDSLRALGVRLLEAGHDEALALAIADDADSDEVATIFLKLCRELGQPTPTLEHARRTVTRSTLSRIVDGTLAPEAGLAHLIYDITPWQDDPAADYIGQTWRLERLVGMYHDYDQLRDSPTASIGDQHGAQAIPLLDREIISRAREWLEDDAERNPAHERHTCPVCGYPDLTERPRLPGGGGSYEICPSCGFEFGVTDDDRGHSYEQWRARWVEHGMQWDAANTESSPPPGWQPTQQLQRLLDAPPIPIDDRQKGDT